MNGLNTSGLDKMTVKNSAQEHVPNPDALKFNVELTLYIVLY